MKRYSTEPRANKYVKAYVFSFSRNPPDKYGKKLLDTARRAKLDALKLFSKK